MARDILAIPITTVASESAFSTSGRILDDFRTSLTPFMVQALVCTQDWLRRSTNPVDIKENLEELEVLEKGKTISQLVNTFVFFIVEILLCMTCISTKPMYGELYMHDLTNFFIN